MTAGATADVSIRVQALSGQWETFGADRAISVLPETVGYNHNEWGADRASFTLKRSPIALWPDLGAFAPIEIEIGGVVVWEGRTDQTPIKNGAAFEINVQCLGWQYHLDDDVYQRTYVHSKLTDWKDSRSYTECPLTSYKQSGNVQVQQGRVTIGYAKGAVVANGEAVGVTLDLGPATPGGVYVAVDAELVGSGEGFQLIVTGHNGWETGAIWKERTDAVSGSALGTGNYQGGIAARRFISVLVWRNGAEVTQAEDLSFIVTAVRVFTDAAFKEGAKALSALKASQVVPDALERATLLLSTDYSQIMATSFVIPDFVLSKLSTAREVIEAANTYHNWVAKLGLNRRFYFNARPTAPVLEVGSWSQSDTEDLSANSGAEIYNRCMIEATGPDGMPLVVSRYAGQQPGVKYVATEAQPDNPSFAVNAASWAASGGGTIVRETAESHSAPASGKWTPSANNQTLTETFTGTFRAGVPYLLTFWLKRLGASQLPAFVIAFGAGSDGEEMLRGFGTAWAEVSILWVPTANRTGVTLTIRNIGGATYGALVDDLNLTAALPTLVDRRGFRRTKVIQPSSAITATEGQQLADIFLQSHMTTPFKGSDAATPGSVRKVLGGQPVHPSQLGLYTQQKLRCSNLVDPDTGGVGRDGVIAEVAYTHKDQKAQITLDDKRGNFEALLQRLAVVQTPGS